MKVIRPSVEIIPQDTSNFIGIYKIAELVGRVAYKSEDKISEDSYKKFIEMIIQRGHLAVLEHATVYLTIIDNSIYEEKAISFYKQNTYSQVVGYPVKGKNKSYTDAAYITTNLRVLQENNRLEDLKFWEQTIRHKTRVTVKFICDRGVSHEFVRHRVFSFMQESTRYCNYSRDKFNKEVTFIAPPWVSDIELAILNTGDTFEHLPTPVKLWGNHLKACEEAYMGLLKEWVPQQSRAVLPNSLKTELVMTGFKSQWVEFLKLRCAQDAHPQARELAEQLKLLMEL